MLSQVIVSEKRIRRRTPVRWKQIRKEMKELSDVIGIDLNFPNLFLEKGHFQERDLILVDKIPLAFRSRQIPENHGIQQSEEFWLGI